MRCNCKKNNKLQIVLYIIFIINENSYQRYNKNIVLYYRLEDMIDCKDIFT